jgi:hypothetical protein
MAVAVWPGMFEAQLVFAAAATLSVGLIARRLFRARAASLEVTPVSEGWLAERRRIREDLVA